MLRGTPSHRSSATDRLAFAHDATPRLDPNLAVLVAAIAILASCTSDGGSDDHAPIGSGPKGSSAATVDPTGPGPTTTAATPDACSLITAEDAEIALGAEVEIEDDPFAVGLLEGDPAEFASVCAYRPAGAGADDDRGIVIGIAAPGAITSEEFDELTEDGVALGGPGDEGYAVDDGVIFRRGDLVVGVIIESGEGFATDRALSLELAGIAAQGLPAPAPDTSNVVCALLTEELAESILGRDLVFGSDAVVDEQRSGCGYREEAGGGFVSLRVTRGPDEATDFEGALDAASGSEGFRELEGVGDRAFVRVGGGVVDVIVLAGDAFIGTMTFTPEEELVDQTIELATAIAGSI
jgi:hypothetical protein